MADTKKLQILSAASRGYTSDVQELLAEAKLKPDDVKDDLGNTPLHGAAAAGHVETVQLLLRLGAGLNATNNIGETPLHRATWRQRSDVVKVLLGAGADVKLATAAGKTAADLANDEATAALLGAPVTPRGGASSSSSTATTAGSEEVVFGDSDPE